MSQRARDAPMEASFIAVARLFVKIELATRFGKDGRRGFTAPNSAASAGYESYFVLELESHV